MLARFGVLIGTVLTAIMAPAAPASAGTSVHCGDIVKQSVVLTKDLTCTGDGLLIDADGVTIDLNGHQIAGSGSGNGIGTGPDLRDQPRLEVDVSVRNGSIRNFGVGVDVEVSGAAHLDKLAITNNSRGVGSSIPSLTVYVKNCTFQHNVSAIGGGIGLDSGGLMSVVVNNSTFVSNALAVGINGTSRVATIESSVFRGNTTAIDVYNGSLIVKNSQFVSNQQGILAVLEGMTITGSVIRNSSVALDVFDDFYFMTVQGNRFLDSGLGVRISGTNVSTSQFTGNTVNGNGAAGLFVNLRAGSVQISGNSFNRNGFAPGSYTDPSGRPLISGAWANAGTFTGNVATHNAGYGIEGYGVTDGGANIARHNGNPAQCLGVVCATY